MKLTGVHFLLSYQCTNECDHCFVWSSPRAGGTMTIAGVRDVLRQARELGTVEWVYFEGGEPFLFFPVLTEALAEATEMGFKTGVVSNCYWATSAEDAELWLRPFADLGVDDLSLSADSFHQGKEEAEGPIWAVEAAHRLGMTERVITIDPPGETCDRVNEKGEPVVGGSVRMRGRAVARLAEGLPRHPWHLFDACPDEDFVEPGRVHVDAYGGVHVCQGILIGDLRTASLSEIVQAYDPWAHPIVEPLLEGGPAGLARMFGVPIDEGYVDPCHLCYHVRSALRGRFPEYLAPGQVYGLEE